LVDDTLTAVITATFLLLSGIWTTPIDSQSRSRRVDDAALREANPEEWLGYGGDYAETQRSGHDP
jgi:hypothetical protein